MVGYVARGYSSVHGAMGVPSMERPLATGSLSVASTYSCQQRLDNSF